jgi:hypothetical protein
MPSLRYGKDKETGLMDSFADRVIEKLETYMEGAGDCLSNKQDPKYNTKILEGMGLALAIRENLKDER